MPFHVLIIGRYLFSQKFLFTNKDILAEINLRNIYKYHNRCFTVFAFLNPIIDFFLNIYAGRG